MHAQKTSEAYTVPYQARTEQVIYSKTILTRWEYFSFQYMRKYEINSHKLTKALLIPPVWPSFCWDCWHISTPPSKWRVSNIHTEGCCESVQKFCNLFTEFFFSQKIYFQLLFFNVYFNHTTERRVQAHGNSMVIVMSVQPQGKSQSSWDFRILRASPNFHNFILWPSCCTHIWLFVWQIDFSL